MPVYYETNLKIRYQNDNGTNAKMIDFIIDRVAMNFAEINSTHLDGIGYAPFDLIAQKNKSYAAFMAQKEESLSVKLQTFIEGYTRGSVIRSFAFRGVPSRNPYGTPSGAVI